MENKSNKEIAQDFLQLVAEGQVKDTMSFI